MADASFADLSHCVAIALDEDRLESADGFWQRVIC